LGLELLLVSACRSGIRLFKLNKVAELKMQCYVKTIPYWKFADAFKPSSCDHLLKYSKFGSFFILRYSRKLYFTQPPNGTLSTFVVSFHRIGYSAYCIRVEQTKAASRSYKLV